MGAREVFEKVSDGESGPMLDLGLAVWESVMIDSLRYQEPRDESESLLGGSSELYSGPDDNISPSRTIESLLLMVLFGESNRKLADEGLAVVGRDCVSG